MHPAGLLPGVRRLEAGRGHRAADLPAGSRPGYPCPTAPASFAAAETLGLSRVRYGPPAAWAGPPFADLHDRLQALVTGGPPPGGAAMADRFESIVGSPPPPPEAGGAIIAPTQRPLDLVLLASLNAAVAEILGLAWLDATAQPGVRYDYILLADHDGSLRSVGGALDFLSERHAGLQRDRRVPPAERGRGARLAARSARCWPGRSTPRLHDRAGRRRTGHRRDQQRRADLGPAAGRRRARGRRADPLPRLARGARQRRDTRHGRRRRLRPRHRERAAACRARGAQPAERAFPARRLAPVRAAVRGPRAARRLVRLPRQRHRHFRPPFRQQPVGGLAPVGAPAHPAALVLPRSAR